jgi:uncharacterized protein YndB with AHSA1/START domain
VSHDLRVERWFDATPGEVFDAYTDPDAQREWYQDQPGWVVEADCDLRVGGRWTVAFGPPGSEPYREENVFSEVDRPRRLVYTSTVKMPDGSSFDTGMDVTFEEQGGRTRMTIRHTGFPTAELRDDHQGGWPGFLDRLQGIVDARVAG